MNVRNVIKRVTQTYWDQRIRNPLIMSVCVRETDRDRERGGGVKVHTKNHGEVSGIYLQHYAKMAD
jgi:hypothetical protein